MNYKKNPLDVKRVDADFVGTLPYPYRYPVLPLYPCGRVRACTGTSWSAGLKGVYLGPVLVSADPLPPPHCGGKQVVDPQACFIILSPPFTPWLVWHRS